MKNIELTNIIFSRYEDACRFIDWYNQRMADKGKVLLSDVSNILCVFIPDDRREELKHFCFTKTLKHKIHRIYEGYQVVLPKKIETV